ncbi:MAG: hypothetical protein KJO38_05020, partial [Gammaproteobacteria bacterium]|nr:hypothetical protein [Gammaproteobacteria bacterium]
MLFEDDYRFVHTDGDDQFAAFWTFDDLARGDYEVLVTYPEAESRSTGVVYTATTDASVVDIDNVFNPALTAPPAPTPIAGGNMVLIDTDTLDLTITGDNDADDAAFFGAPFTAQVIGGLAVFTFDGDLHIGPGTIKVVGDNALSIQVSNNVYIDQGAVFDLAASPVDGAGPGGGDAAASGGQAGINSGLSGDGGAGGVNSGSQGRGGSGG